MYYKLVEPYKKTHSKWSLCGHENNFKKDENKTTGEKIKYNLFSD